MRYFPPIISLSGLFLLMTSCSSGQITQKEAEFAFTQKYLLKDESLRDYYSIEEEGIMMYSSPEAKFEQSPEIILYRDEFNTFLTLSQTLPADSFLNLYQNKGTERWNDSLFSDMLESHVDFSSIDSTKPLTGWRIAIDPGHIAGDFEMAEIEGKYMKMHPSPMTDMQPIQFFEANLALGTAHIVREKLEEMGAMVLMSRTEPNTGALGITFEEWRREWFPQLLSEEIEENGMTRKREIWWKTQAKDKDLMSGFFIPQDLKERAKKINAFQPHLTLIIHYNVDSPNWEKRDEEGYFVPTGENYCMAFVPGSFMKGELEKPEARVEFLRLLISDEIEQSIHLSDAFIRNSTEITGVPIVDPEYPLGYLHRASILSDYPGVYARNLTLSRLIKGPLCYGESLCQDNIIECQALNQSDANIGNFMVSSRVKTVAEAYVQA
ncbi:MAG: N-acetylmuramoyl-L-alanine amidase, partial [Bacteroidetes bacterium]|nr:N-acetylmuramoyl-L-alanine amidase [Bacteroidota bacterium]